MGEASRQRSNSFRTQHNHIPSHAMIGMRNRIAHEYLNINLDMTWEVVQHDLPTLKTQIGRLLE
ncbi:HepT-like ribonuclease domain-containing protein [Salisaeta longa]|uniref:HepT-like ribonuclease domain-containing protein n=1 Tax=Salisaeta longa TaxID=503170 RepID=UPI003899EF65